MKDNKILPICILILSISIVFAGIWIGNSIRSCNNSQNYSKALMTEKEAAEYLNLPHDKFKEILNLEFELRSGLTVYDTFRYIPYIKIEGVKYFSKEHIDKWVEYNSERRRVIFIDF